MHVKHNSLKTIKHILMLQYYKYLQNSSRPKPHHMTITNNGKSKKKQLDRKQSRKTKKIYKYILVQNRTLYPKD